MPRCTPSDVCRLATRLALGAALALSLPASRAADLPVQVDTLAKTARSWDGSALPAYPAGTPEITALRIRVAPGVRLGVHQHPLINLGVVTRGELTVVTESGQTTRIKAGETIVEVVNQWHYGHNQGSEPVEIIVFYIGTPEVPLSVAKPQ